jgi:esterase/lipase superfamily enzyme
MAASLTYHSPMHRDYRSWHSDLLGRQMEMLIFGHAGQPVFVFPTSMGAFFEYEDRGMVQALAGKIDAGMLRLFCLQTLDQESFYAQRHPRERIERYLQWERSLLQEIVPFAKHVHRPRHVRCHLAAVSALITRSPWRCGIPTCSPPASRWAGRSI